MDKGWVLASLALAVVSLGSLGCKSQRLTDAEAYEREQCACKPGDFACAKTVRDKYRPLLEASFGWYERKFLADKESAAIQQHDQAAHACYSTVWRCGGASKVSCPAGYACASTNPTSGDSFCDMVRQEGEDCGGHVGGVCVEGTFCEYPVSALTMSEPCGIVGPCTGTGKCVKGTAPAGLPLKPGGKGISN